MTAVHSFLSLVILQMSGPWSEQYVGSSFFSVACHSPDVWTLTRTICRQFILFCRLSFSRCLDLDQNNIMVVYSFLLLVILQMSGPWPEQYDGSSFFSVACHSPDVWTLTRTIWRQFLLFCRWPEQWQFIIFCHLSFSRCPDLEQNSIMLVPSFLSLVILQMTGPWPEQYYGSSFFSVTCHSPDVWTSTRAILW